MMDEKQYLAQVEKVLTQLRARCLGQDTKLTELLPPHAKGKDARYQAKYLAAQLQFALVHAEEYYVTPNEHQRCRHWLEDILYFLLDGVREEDRTVYQLIRVVNLPQEIRSLVLQNYLCSNSDILTNELPTLLQNLDIAIWWLMGVQNKQTQSSRFLDFLLSAISSPNPH